MLERNRVVTEGVVWEPRPGGLCPKICGSLDTYISLICFHGIFSLLLFSRVSSCPQKSCVETITLNVIILGDGAFGRWWGHEDEPLWWNSCPFEKKKRARAFSLSATWGQGEDGALWTSERVLPRTRPRWPRDLGLSASRSVRNKFLLFRSPGVRYVYYSSLKGLRHFFIHMRHDFYFS